MLKTTCGLLTVAAVLAVTRGWSVVPLALMGAVVFLAIKLGT
jgi:hypothetical protein